MCHALLACCVFFLRGLEHLNVQQGRMENESNSVILEGRSASINTPVTHPTSDELPRKITCCIFTNLSGLGTETGKLLRSNGAKLALLYAPFEKSRVDPTIESAYGANADDVKAYECDITIATSVHSAFAAIAKDDAAFSWLLVNAAGYVNLQPLESFPEDDVYKHYMINLYGPTLTGKAFANAYVAAAKKAGDSAPGGRIVNIASQAAHVALHHHGPYCASKAGLIGLTRCMASEWGPRGITANSISPGPVMTELGKKAWGDEKLREEYQKAVPSGKFAEPFEVARIVDFLARDEALNINGDDVRLDGGFTGIWATVSKDLFSYRHSLHTGPFRAKAGQMHCFPFSVNALQPPAGFPPTFQLKFYNHPYNIEMAVKQELTAEIRLPGIKIRATGPGLKDINYVPPPAPAPSQQLQRIFYRQRVAIQSRNLLRESERAHGLSRWYKHHIERRPYPTLPFDVLCSSRQSHIHTGQNLEFDLILNPTSIDSITTTTPITLKSFTVHLLAITKIDSLTLRSCCSNFFQDIRVVQILERPSSFPLTFPAQLRHHKTRIALGPVAEHMPAFQHAKVERKYEFRVKLVFQVAGKVSEVKFLIPVKILEPRVGLGGGDARGYNEIGDQEDDFLEEEDDEDLEEPLPMYRKGLPEGEVMLPGYLEREEGV
ncbi:uncharacterized protein MYCFIDRAFT_87949 [Pseudocercospora fijiensis CIRAD86]|uniref:Uncharacterized protein n=1 Tax=Pseudocercospora fijiensis (strain CIRAD86) TaxID=383855 RepID=M3AQS6_PSEFD|nr:uncharacterized protein MYCFIDRAFT_87949 [Pseudocercospora fijiensis CIRAD86]EME79752.1 hypothetical protein MYCFIDRAFT_87949 [Pseudocercospora fijiensis CIRAD86]